MFCPTGDTHTALHDVLTVVVMLKKKKKVKMVIVRWVEVNFCFQRGMLFS